MTQDIKPCPFCGSNDIRCFYNESEDTYFVFCNECAIRTAKYPTREQALQVWNKREGK
ncbi:MAG: restriction alleviation protein, Lar family [Clostridia bacterium]|nr:restriction alleviation protein, Lar family [Clostridia bacterium]